MKKHDKKKRLSTVAITVILIAIVLLLLAIAWIVAKNAKQENGSDEVCFDAAEKVEINSKYTLYNPDLNQLQFSISMGNIEVDEVLVTISGDSSAKILKIKTKAQEIKNLANYRSTDFGNEQIKLPEKNSDLTYVYDMSNFFGEPDSITISPVIDKTQCRACDSLYEIKTAGNTSCNPDCSCASAICIGETCSDGCGGTCAGKLESDCGARECGAAPNTCGNVNECGVCNFTSDCVSGFCVKANKTCEAKQGTICTGEQYCSGNLLSASDTTRCCDSTCKESICTLCSTCGAGLFNTCERQECYACTSDACYFLNNSANKCNSCDDSICESYGNDKQTCSDDVCESGNCLWGGNACFTKGGLTCIQLQGIICKEEQYCSGSILDASDTTRCCDGNCKKPICTSCNTCGDGLLNVCDRQECYACTSDACYFLNNSANKCNSCTGASCESYGNDKQTCSDDVCGLGNCLWSGSVCYTNRTFTCAELNGTICTGEQYCSGSILDVSDTNRCCDSNCKEPTCTICDTCGEGLFNVCDRAECYACTSDTCYFLDRLFADECNSCTDATCDSYDNDQQTCSDDVCGLGNCEWDGSGCVEASQICSDECSYGQTQCTTGGNIQRCGDYDNDDCLEFGSPESCPGGQSCLNGVCQASGGGEIVDESDVTIVDSGHKGYYSLGAGERKYFKIVAGVPDCDHPIQVSNTPGSSNQPCTVHLLIKRGSKPTIADFERTWKMSQSQSSFGGLYWKYNTGSQAEFVEISKPMESGTFYFMLYNSGTKAVQQQRLTVYYWQ